MIGTEPNAPGRYNMIWCPFVDCARSVYGGVRDVASKYIEIHHLLDIYLGLWVGVVVLQKKGD